MNQEVELKGFGGFEGVELLQRLHLFEKLTFDETSRLGNIIEYIDLGPDTVVIEQHALGNALYVIVDGRVKVTRDGAEASEDVADLQSGELFGEMSLVDDLLTSARITTVTRCRLLKLPRDRFEALLATDEKLAVKVYRSFCRTLSDRLRRSTAMLVR